MNAKILNALLILTSLFGYLELGAHKQFDSDQQKVKKRKAMNAISEK